MIQLLIEHCRWYLGPIIVIGFYFTIYRLIDSFYLSIAYHVYSFKFRCSPISASSSQYQMSFSSQNHFYKATILLIEHTVIITVSYRTRQTDIIILVKLFTQIATLCSSLMNFSRALPRLLRLYHYPPKNIPEWVPSTSFKGLIGINAYHQQLVAQNSR